MRWWVFGAGAALVLWVVVDGFASSHALSDIAARPIVALTRDGGATRVPVAAPGTAPLPGMARPRGGVGIALGYSLSFAMPEGETVDCRIRLGRLSCTKGWQGER